MKQREYPVVTGAGGVVRLPYAEAKKAKQYPVWCVSAWHEEVDEPARAERGANLCQRCSDLLRESWEIIARRWVDLEEVLVASRGGGGERVNRGKMMDAPLPFDADVSEVMRLARAAVWSTIRWLVDDREVKLPADQSTSVLADWLARWHVSYIASHPSSSHTWTVLQQAYDVATEVKRLAFRAGPTTVPIAAHCSQWTVNDKGERVRCTGSLEGVELVDGRRGVECSVDPGHWVPIEVWWQMDRAAKPRPSRALRTVQRKYARHAGTGPMSEGA